MEAKDKIKVTYEVLQEYGIRWAVLAAFLKNLESKGIEIPKETKKELELAYTKVVSGVFSTCEVACSLGSVEGMLVSKGSALGQDYMEIWFDLLAKAMRKELKAEDIGNIPFLKIVMGECKFLKCSCD